MHRQSVGLRAVHMQSVATLKIGMQRLTVVPTPSESVYESDHSETISKVGGWGWGWGGGLFWK